MSYDLDNMMQVHRNQEEIMGLNKKLAVSQTALLAIGRYLNIKPEQMARILTSQEHNENYQNQVIKAMEKMNQKKASDLKKSAGGK